MEPTNTQQTEPAAGTPSAPVARWGQERRLEFIDFRLQWDGRINRSDLTDFFGISAPQASSDIGRYLALAPANAEYDRSSRMYLAMPGFTSVYGSGAPARYLNELLASVTGVLLPGASFLGWRPEVAVVPSPIRTLSLDTLIVLMRAIRERVAVRMQYQSMTRETPGTRVIAPHALANDGMRWHVRAYCSEHKAFRDFVIARISSPELLEMAAAKGPEQDMEWQRVLRLVLVPHPGLTRAQRLAIELDYAMEGGSVVLECRQALAFYLLRRLNLLDERDIPPARQQVVLANREELQPFVAMASQGG